MAGSIAAQANLEGSVPRRWYVRGLAVLVVFLIGAFVASPALAQVPSVPEVPGLPPEVVDAIETAQETIIPVLIDAALAAQPAANAGGFALRPACASTGTAILLVVIAGGTTLPVSPGFLSTPLLLFCAGAFAPGPVDPVFDTVDQQAGPSLESNLEPVIVQAGDAMAPARPNLSDVCGVYSLAGSGVNQTPPPLNRFDVLREVCSP